MGMSRTNTFHTLFSSVSIFFLLLTTCKALRPCHFTTHHHHHHHHHSKGTYKAEEDHVHIKSSKKCGGQEGGIGMELYPMGSSLPDCSHACGPCTPCRRVMVSSECSVESCPVIYRCTCKGKYYHVPSN